MFHLTREQRSGFFAGQWPRLAGEGTCPVKSGYVHRLSSRLAFEVTMVRHPKAGGWKLDYIVLDRRPDRDRYLLPASHSLRLAPSGEPEPMTREEELGYTGNPKPLNPKSPPPERAISEEHQEVISLQARKRFAEHRRRDQLEEDNRRAVRAAASKVRETAIGLIRSGSDPTGYLAQLHRVSAAYEADKNRAA